MDMLSLTLLSSRPRGAEGPPVLLENGAEMVPWEKRLVLTKEEPVP